VTARQNFLPFAASKEFSAQSAQFSEDRGSNEAMSEQVRSSEQRTVDRTPAAVFDFSDVGKSFLHTRVTSDPFTDGNLGSFVILHVRV